MAAAGDRRPLRRSSGQLKCPLVCRSNRPSRCRKIAMPAPPPARPPIVPPRARPAAAPTARRVLASRRVLAPAALRGVDLRRWLLLSPSPPGAASSPRRLLPLSLGPRLRRRLRPWSLRPRRRLRPWSLARRLLLHRTSTTPDSRPGTQRVLSDRVGAAVHAIPSPSSRAASGVRTIVFAFGVANLHHPSRSRIDMYWKGLRRDIADARGRGCEQLLEEGVAA